MGDAACPLALRTPSEVMDAGEAIIGFLSGSASEGVKLCKI
jgi:hypothetical protein